MTPDNSPEAQAQEVIAEVNQANQGRLNFLSALLHDLTNVHQAVISTSEEPESGPLNAANRLLIFWRNIFKV